MSDQPSSNIAQASHDTFEALAVDGRDGLAEGEPVWMEQRIWWHNPLHLVQLPGDLWDAAKPANLRARVISAPTLWNGQDTGNIFHVPASFLGRVWIEARLHFPGALELPNVASEGGVGGAKPWHAGNSSDSTADSISEVVQDVKLIYVFDLHPKRPAMFDSDGRP